MTSNLVFAFVLSLLLFAGSSGPAVAAHRQSVAMTPLQVSASGRYFVTANGKPWFWLGDTAWSLLTNYTPAQQKTYLAARAKKGFTIVQMVAVWDGGTGTEEGRIPNANTAGVQPWRDGDPLKPNEMYWKQVDAVVADAAKDGLYVGLLPSWGSFVVNYKMITPANAEAYGRWLGRRYRNAPNIVWIEGGDRDVIWYGKGSKKYAPYLDVWRAMARGLREGDDRAHLILFHPGGTLRNDQREKWLAADMIQTWAWYKNVPGEIAIDYGRTPTKPVILAEGAYEDGPELSTGVKSSYPTGPITPLIVRKQAYWAYLSGAFFTYGYDHMWEHPPYWRKALDSEGARNMQVLRKLFDTVSWWNLRPDQALFATGEGSGQTNNAAAVSSDKSWAMVYLSSLTTVKLDLSRLGPGRFRAVWIDPRSGARQRQKPLDGSGEKSFTTPAGWPDAVLLLRRDGTR
jgi:hypothetical protein